VRAVFFFFYQKKTQKKPGACVWSSVPRGICGVSDDEMEQHGEYSRRVKTLYERALPGLKLCEYTVSTP
jgi:hypothetical protein